MSKIGTNHILCILSPKNAEIEKPKNIRGLEIAKNDCIKYVYFREVGTTRDGNRNASHLKIKPKHTNF